MAVVDLAANLRTWPRRERSAVSTSTRARGIRRTLDHLGRADQRRLSELVGVDPRNAVRSWTCCSMLKGLDDHQQASLHRLLLTPDFCANLSIRRLAVRLTATDPGTMRRWR